MKINVLTCLDCQDRLISYHRHDFKRCSCGASFLDGGFDYIRYGGNNVVLEEKNIKDMRDLISSTFQWTQNYDENNNRIDSKTALLKDLTSSHICGILSYFTERLTKQEKDTIVAPTKEWCVIHDIFIQELDYRIKNQLI